MQSKNLESSRPAPWRQVLASFVSVTMVSQAVAACGGPIEVQPPTEAPRSRSALLRATTTVDGTQIEVVARKEEGGTRFVGTRFMRSPDGTAQEEAIEFDVAGAGSALDESGAFAVPGVDGITLTVAQATSRPGGASYLLKSNLGHEIAVDVEGDSDYVVWAAVALLASIGGLVILAVCGFLVYTSIKNCAKLNRCWEYKLSRGFCSGTCRRC